MNKWENLVCTGYTVHDARRSMYCRWNTEEASGCFHKHLHEVETNVKDTFKLAACHFNLPHYSIHDMEFYGLSLHQGNTWRCKILEKKIIFNPYDINESLLFSKYFTYVYFLNKKWYQNNNNYHCNSVTAKVLCHFFILSKYYLFFESAKENNFNLL